MKINSKGFDVHMSLKELQALRKMVGNSTLYSLIKNYQLSEEEAKTIQETFTELDRFIPSDEEGE